MLKEKGTQDLNRGKGEIALPVWEGRLMRVKVSSKKRERNSESKNKFRKYYPCAVLVAP